MTGEPRVIGQLDSGGDVALLQADLNRWLRCWGAEANTQLSRDGLLGPATATVALQVGQVLGLALVDPQRVVAIGARERAVIRHWGRALAGSQTGQPYTVPALASRTGDELARAGRATDSQPRQVAELAEARAADAPRVAASSFPVSASATRNERRPRLIVVHTSQGHDRSQVTDLAALAQVFEAQGSADSVHVANDPAGRDARYVDDALRAFAGAPSEAVALHLEHLGPANRSQWTGAQLENAATWVAFWHQYWGIPIVRSTESGVCVHCELDSQAPQCASDYPIGFVLDRAHRLVAEAYAAAPEVAGKWLSSVLYLLAPGLAGAWGIGRSRRGPSSADVSNAVEYPDATIDAIAGVEEAWLLERIGSAETPGSAAEPPAGATKPPVSDRTGAAPPRQPPAVGPPSPASSPSKPGALLVPKSAPVTAGVSALTSTPRETGKEKMSLIPKTTKPLGKFIRTGEGILVFAFNIALLVVPIVSNALTPDQAVKWAAIVNGIAVLSRTGLKMVAVSQGVTGIAPQQLNPAVPVDVQALAKELAVQLPDALKGTTSATQIATDVSEDLPGVEKLVSDAEKITTVPAPVGSGSQMEGTNG